MSIDGCIMLTDSSFILRLLVLIRNNLYSQEKVNQQIIHLSSKILTAFSRQGMSIEYKIFLLIGHSFTIRVVSVNKE